MKMSIELSIVMPCLNEAETLKTCIKKANDFLQTNDIQGEVIIGDNGSTDGSQAIAIANGAKVIDVAARGYGSALKGGIKAAKGTYVIMGDADDSYDFTTLMPYLIKLREGNDLVMGNRFKGGIKKGAMPFLHKYLGNPVLSFLGRLFFKSNIGDFHCGLRGFSKEAFIAMDLQTTGMEFASEMIVKASLKNMAIAEVPTILSPDGRTRPPHLNTWSDGWRHLRFLLLYSPSWLFMIPGVSLMIVGSVLSTLLIIGPLDLGGITLGVHTLLYSCAAFLIGFQLLLFYGLTKIYTVENELLPKSKKYDSLFDILTLEKGLIVGFILILVALGATMYAYLNWKSVNFGDITGYGTLQVVVPAVTIMLLGVQTILFSFFFSILGLKK